MMTGYSEALVARTRRFDRAANIAVLAIMLAAALLSVSYWG
jgi:hypothetical protein